MSLYCRMWQLKHSLLRGLRAKTGAATAEYALLLALVVVMLITTLTALGQTLRDSLEDIIHDLEQGL